MKAAAYARYSTDNQTGNSIAYQMERINNYALAHDIDVIARYIDEAETGTNTDRPGFKDMMRDASAGSWNAIVIYDVTRGSRDVGDWFTFRKTMLMLGIQVISVEDKLGDMLNGNDFLVELLNVGLGQHHVLTSRRKSMDGVYIKAKDGKFLGGIPPLGFDIKDQQYFVNESEARCVRLIFKMYAAGESLDAITEALAKMNMNGKRGRPVGKNSIYSILQNERYIGTYIWNEHKCKVLGKWVGGGENDKMVRIPGRLPRIIDDKTWGRVRARMNKRENNAVNKAKRDYLFTGLIECEKCGAKYVAYSRENKYGVRYVYYTCGNKYRTKTCDAKNLSGDLLESFVAGCLIKYITGQDFTTLATAMAKGLNGASPDLSAEKKELAEIDRQLANCLKAVKNGIDFPELQDEMSNMRRRKSELEEILSRQQPVRQWFRVDDIIASLKESALMLEDSRNFKTLIKNHVIKIQSHADGSFSVHMGVVHTTGSGTRVRT